MKGLVRKDLKLLAKMDNRIFVIVLYAFAISIAYFGNADIYALQSTLFFSLFLGMHLMMTLTYDGMSAWKEYEMTLPLSVKTNRRKQISVLPRRSACQFNWNDCNLYNPLGCVPCFSG